MEGVAAFGLAANILQVIELTQKLLSTGHQIYQAGETVQNYELLIVLKDLTVLNKRLQSSARPAPDVFGPITADGQSLELFASESERIAQDLTVVLESLRVDWGSSKLKSFLQGIKTAWSAKKVEETKKRLDEIQKAIQFRILVLMREDQACIRDEVLQSLDDVTCQVVVSVLAGKDEIITQQIMSDRLASQRHDQVVELISKRRELSLDTTEIPGRILAHLRYSAQNDRYDDIAPAHKDTFHWATQEHGGDRSSPNLHRWLREGEGIYWISGKAGSGKSTLMKVLYQDAGMNDALTTWAGNAKLIKVHFYFWKSGSTLQKSQEGLFRSILFQVLEQEPSLSEVLFPEQYLPSATWPQFPTFYDSQRALSSFTRSLGSFKKVVMFVDGLDEFDDAMNLTMTELAENFLDLTRVCNIKALLSSRPLAPFEFKFQQQPKLRLQDLTRKDITAYVNDKLVAHPRIMVLSKDDPRGVRDLIGDIVESAAGVFLWVKLVVRSLLEGLQNYDKLLDLERRLRQLPQDLEDLFRHMLLNVPAEYKMESSRFFQIVRCHEEAFALRGGRGLSAISLYRTDETDATVLSKGMARSTEADIKLWEEEVTGRLRSRCAGLLETRIDVPILNEPARESNRLRVEYIHKSVADFLAKEEIWSEITRHTDGTDFNASITLLRSTIIQAKCPRYYGQFLWDTAADAAVYARSAEDSLKAASPVLLDELDRCMCVHFDNNMLWRAEELSSWYDCEEEYDLTTRDDLWHDNFLAFAVRSGLLLYVEMRLKKSGKICIQKNGRPLLEYACVPTSSSSPNYLDIRLDMVELLLNYGADPNEAWGRRAGTVWQNALQRSFFDPPKWVAIVGSLVRSVASLNVCLEEQIYWEGGLLRSNDQRSVERSVLRYVKIEVQRASLGKAAGPHSGFHDDRGDWSHFQYPKYYNGGRVQPEVLEKFKVAADELLELLVSRGAMDWERRKDKNGVWRQIFPEERSIAPDTTGWTELGLSQPANTPKSLEQSGTTVAVFTNPSRRSQQGETKILKPARNPFRRLKQHLTRSKET